MITDIKLPELSESVTAADVVKVLVKPGDVVAVDQPLLELETEKAVFEMPSPEAGTIVEVLAEKGQRVQVGQVVARLEVMGGERSPRPSRPRDDAGTRGRGDAESKAREGGRGLGGKTVMEEAPSLAPRASHLTPSSPEPWAPLPSAPAAPGIRRLARELGVDITQVQGTGPRGRISVDDVKIHAKLVMGGQPAATSPHAPPAKALPDFSRFGPVRREPMSKVRRITAQSMAHAWATVPTVTQYDKADITELEAFRQRHAKAAGAAGGKLTLTAILAKIVATGLGRFPQANASVDMERGEIVFKDFVHLGIAVDTDRGLLVPVVRDADKKTIPVISAEIAALAEKARTKHITPEEMEGGTFTISNLGGVGGTGFAPIVYWPQVAILGVSRAEMQPIWRESQFAPRLILPLSLSYDHRLIDGADGARFLRWICQVLEEPLLMVF